MHDWATLVLLDPATSTNSTNLKIALIAAVSLILAAAVPALLSTKEREPKAARELRVDLKAQRDALQRKLTERDLRVDELENLCWSAGINPHTGNPIGDSSEHA